MLRRPLAVLAVLVGPIVGVVPPRSASALAAGGVLDVTVAGRAGVPTVGVGAVVLNVTATDVESASFVTVWPTGSARPLASNLNLAADDTVANLVLVPLGDGGKVSLYQHGGPAELVVDVTGWFPTGAGLRAVTPARVLDTRGASVPLRAGSTVAVPVTGRVGVPSGAAADRDGAVWSLTPAMGYVNASRGVRIGPKICARTFASPMQSFSQSMVER